MRKVVLFLISLFTLTQPALSLGDTDLVFQAELNRAWENAGFSLSKKGLVRLYVGNIESKSESNFNVPNDCLNKNSFFGPLIEKKARKLVEDRASYSDSSKWTVFQKEYNSNLQDVRVSLNVSDINAFKKALLFYCAGKISFTGMFSLAQLYEIQDEFAFGNSMINKAGLPLSDRIEEFLESKEGAQYLERASLEEKSALLKMNQSISDRLKKNSLPAELLETQGLLEGHLTSRVESPPLYSAPTYPTMEEVSAKAFLIHQQKDSQLNQIVDHHVKLFMKELGERLESHVKQNVSTNKFRTAIQVPASYVNEILSELEKRDDRQLFTFQQNRFEIPKKIEGDDDDSRYLGCDCDCNHLRCPTQFCFSCFLPLLETPIRIFTWGCCGLEFRGSKDCCYNYLCGRPELLNPCNRCVYNALSRDKREILVIQKNLGERYD